MFKAPSPSNTPLPFTRTPEPDSSDTHITYILIATSKAGGLGDLFFALKFAAGLTQEIKQWPEPYQVILVADNDSHHNLLELIDENPGAYYVNVLSLDELETLSCEHHIAMIIQGPTAFQDEGVLFNISDSLNQKEQKPLWLVMPEYGCSSYTPEVTKIERQLKYIDKDIEYAGILETGFNIGSLGVFSSSIEEENYALEERLWSRVNHILASLPEAVGSSPPLYSLCYQNAKHTEETLGNYNAHFLCVHAAFFQDTPNHQIVFMVGEDEDLKKNALISIAEWLTNYADYTKVVWHNADELQSEQEIIRVRTDKPEKAYHVIYTERMSHKSMLACYKLSGPIVGATGDQSFIEAIELGKIVVYQTLEHKKQFIDGYDYRLQEASNNKSKINEIMKWLRGSRYELDHQYLEHAKLLRKHSAELLNANRQVVNEHCHLLKNTAELIYRVLTGPKESRKAIFKEKQTFTDSFYGIPSIKIRSFFKDIDLKIKRGEEVSDKDLPIIEEGVSAYELYLETQYRHENGFGPPPKIFSLRPK